jgi:hypothetical protein
METFTFATEPFTGYSESSKALESWEFNQPGELQFERGGRPRTSYGMSGARASHFGGVRQRATSASSRGGLGAASPKLTHGYGGATSHYQRRAFGKAGISPTTAGAAAAGIPPRSAQLLKKLPPGPGRQPQPVPPGDYPQPRPPGWPFAFAYPGPTPDDGGPPPVAGPAGSEYVSWVQDSLNRVLGAQLPVDGVMTPDVRNAISSFQQQSGLPVSGIVGPDTERALLDGVRGNQPG